MRARLAMVALSMLTACIEVHDVGSYWDRGTTDRALVGRWRQEREDGIRETTPKAFSVIIKNGEYRVGTDNESDAPISGRTLKVGGYTFFMTHPTSEAESVLYRYTLRLDVIELLDLETDNLDRWLRRNYPGQKKLRLTPTSLDTLDESAFDILSHVPDDALYWRTADDGRQRYRRISKN